MTISNVATLWAEKVNNSCQSDKRMRPHTWVVETPGPKWAHHGNRQVVLNRGQFGRQGVDHWDVIGYKGRRGYVSI